MELKIYKQETGSSAIKKSTLHKESDRRHRPSFSHTELSLLRFYLILFFTERTLIKCQKQNLRKQHSSCTPSAVSTEKKNKFLPKRRETNSTVEPRCKGPNSSSHPIRSQKTAGGNPPSPRISCQTFFAVVTNRTTAACAEHNMVWVTQMALARQQLVLKRGESLAAFFFRGAWGRSSKLRAEVQLELGNLHLGRLDRRLC